MSVTAGCRDPRGLGSGVLEGWEGQSVGRPLPSPCTPRKGTARGVSAGARDRPSQVLQAAQAAPRKLEGLPHPQEKRSPAVSNVGCTKPEGLWTQQYAQTPNFLCSQATAPP